MHKQHPQTAYRKYAVSIGTVFENCDNIVSLPFRCRFLLQNTGRAGETTAQRALSTGKDYFDDLPIKRALALWNLPERRREVFCTASNVQIVSTKRHKAALHLAGVLAILSIERNFI